MIWLAEDNPADVYLIRAAFQRHEIDRCLTVAQDGEEAIRLVADADKGGPVPEVALVDLNLPRFSGSEVVKGIRSSARCHDVPVIIISSSASLEDREETSSLGIAAYFRKPSDFEEFMRLGEVVKTVLQKRSDT